MRLKGSLQVFIVLLALVLQPNVAAAQGRFAGGTIEEIRVEGSQRVEPLTVRSYMGVNPGDPFDPLTLDRALKSIFATGLFADVTLRREGGALIVSVVENPIINRIAFEGNDAVDDETLAGETELRPRVVFTRAKVQNDVRRLLDVYRRSGRFAATVDPKVIQLEQNRVDLVFEINEGEATGIKSINFVGNRAFSDSALRDEITTSETAWWRFFTSSDTYDPDRLTFDQELLRRFYLSEGYADFRVGSVVAELAPDREGFYITFTVEEGERYKFGSVDVISGIRNLEPESLREQLTTSVDDWYNAEAVEESVNNLSEAVGNLGFAFVDIRPRVQRDRDQLLINMTYDIQEGPKVFVERIDIEGNIRTLDRVIRREFRLVEGDAFNSAKLRRSRQRIRDLGFFQTVEVTNEQGTAADTTIITIDVEEQSTGDLSFGAGFSSAAGPIGNVSLRERNLLGRGQDLRVGLALSGSRSQIDLSFTEPYFLNRNLSAGFDIFRINTEQDESSFDLSRIGGSLRAGFSYNERLRQVWRYSLEHQEIKDVDSDASLLIQDEEGSRFESSIGQELTYSTLDSRFEPTEGFFLSLGTQFAGVGGSVRFIKGTVGGGYFIPVLDDWVLGIRGEVGRIQGLGEDTRVSNRFFVGGGNLRGFKFAGVGPRDRATDDAVGAKNFYTGSAELTFPLGLPEEFGVKGRLFTDVGSAWDFDGGRGVVDDEASLRASVGAGISWASPFGPVVFDFGFAVLDESFDETEIFRFSFGTQF